MKHFLQTFRRVSRSPEDPAPPAGRPVPLRRQRDYRLLFTARAVTETGTEISRLAVPLTAAALLGASPAQMGVLTAATSLPHLLFGLQAGALADRLRRHRPVMVGCDLVSALAMATVPAAWAVGVLTVPWLVAVAFVVGTCSAIFRAAGFPHLATVVPEGQRTEALAGFQSAFAVATVGGPGLAGLLVQLITAPFALLVDALSFLASAFLIRSIATPENHVPAPPRGLWTEIREGLGAVARNPVLRALCGAGVTINFFGGAFMALFVIYSLTVVHLPAGLIGAVTVCFGVGGLLGAAVVPRLTRRFGENAVVTGAALLFPIDFATTALVSGPPLRSFLFLAASAVISGLGVVAFSICMGTITLREAPAELRGRVNATQSFMIQGVVTLGGLGGGLAGEVLGLRPVFWISAAGVLTATGWILLSPLRHFSAPRVP
ncbi:MFS transporter [Streptosporangium sp. NPDC023615]|uniref:MFS transporter n=1 Tax=Streptosporangium sp. NPDC023615 TaxID=3154794 RepID=UPI0034450BE1